jgi:hypothetical protein
MEVTTPEGLLVLQASILSRDGESHELLLDRPKEIAFFNRRQSHRVCYGQGVDLEVEGGRAELVDVSERGLKFKSKRDYKSGERVLIRLPWESESVGGWIIDGTPLSGSDRGTTEFRAIFEELVEPPDALPKIQAS